MPLVPDKPKMDAERVSCLLEHRIVGLLRAYAEWRGWTRDWALNRLLEYALSREREFHDWLETRAAASTREKSKRPASEETP